MLRLTEREFRAWWRWLTGEREKCPVCGRPMHKLYHGEQDHDQLKSGRIVTLRPQKE
jgi:DNA repair exonuclease SbcCD ATPase subunit